jgi:hypothetical protein
LRLYATGAAMLICASEFERRAGKNKRVLRAALVEDAD